MKQCAHFAAAIALFGLIAPAWAAPQKVAVDDQVVAQTELDEDAGGWAFGGAVGLDWCSKQLTYGLVDNPHAIVTPSAEISFGHDDYFTIALGVEAIFDTTNYGKKEGGYNDRQWKYQELAIGLTLSKAWDTTDILGGELVTELNYTYEYHPSACKKNDWENPDTQWLNFAIGLEDGILNPTFTFEYQLARQGAAGECDGKGGIYATFEISHEFDIGQTFGMEEGVLCLTPGAGIGMGNRNRNLADFGEYADEEDKHVDSFMLRDAFATLELAYAPFDGFTIAPYIGCHQQLDSLAKDAAGDDDFVAYAGIGISYEF